jgi:site-specific recombinase XerD
MEVPMIPNSSSPSSALEAAIESYLDWQALRGSTAGHRKDIGRRLRSFAATLDPEIPLEAVSRDHCTALLREVQDRGRKPNTQLAYFRTLEAFFNWLVADERLSKSPMDRVPKPKVSDEQIKPFTEEELLQLLAAPDRTTFVGLRDCAFIALLADTGLRLTEAVNIRFGDVDTRQRAISVMGKGSKPRTVFYGESAARFLRDYLKRRGTGSPEDRVFVNSLGEPLWKCTMSTRIRDYGRAAGISGKRVSPHTLRHTFAVSWLMGGGDAFSLQRLLGHSTAVMTARYVNFTSRDLGRLHRSLSPLDRIHGEPAGVPHNCQARRKRLR